MGVMRAGLAVVLLALLVGAQHLDEESLQSLESSVTKEDISDDAELIGETKKVKLGLQKTGLKEFEDHAEMNLQQTDMPTIQEVTLKSSKENTKEEKQEDSTSELMEPLLVPDADDTRGSSTEVITESFHSDFPLNDALKEVTTKKSSVVPKKGVESKKPSVPKKGADPESVTPSVFARKGVDAEHLESSVSARKEADPKNNEERKGETIPFSGEKEIIELNCSHPYSKLIVTNGQQRNNTAMSIDSNDLSNYSSTPSEISTAISVAVEKSDYQNQRNMSNKVAHCKPATATDDLTGSENEGWSYGAVVLGLSVFLVFVVVAVIGYWKVQDFKMRRQYARVDYLVEGMYDV